MNTAASNNIDLRPYCRVRASISDDLSLYFRELYLMHLFLVRLKEHLSSGTLEDQDQEEDQDQDKQSAQESLIVRLKSFDASIKVL